jgi:hypothetical protein
MKYDIAARLFFDQNKINPQLFLPLFQKGFMVQIQVGININELLTDHLGLSPDYVEDRVRTVFLDGKPVDDFKKAIVKHGNTLALSAAMPGLVGATFRKGGSLATFRSTITHNNIGSRAEIETGYITIKLFNLLAKELGTLFLKRGVYLDTETAQKALSTLPEHFWKSCKKSQIENMELTPDNLKDVNWGELSGLVFICLE